MPKHEYFDLKTVENLAATLPSYSAISKRLGKTTGYVRYRMGADAEFKAAIERGRAKFVKSDVPDSGHTKAADAALLKTDRDGFETGGYKPNPNRETIIASLEKIPYQSSRHLCQNTSVSIDDVLEVVDTDDDIRFQMVGSIAVYFLKENAPQGKLFNTGENSFAVKAEEKPKDAPHSRKKGESRVTPDAVEKCAFEAFSNEESAERLGISVSTLRDYIYRNKRPDLKAAWKRGQERRKEAGLPSAASISRKKVLEEKRTEKAMKTETTKHSNVPVTKTENKQIIGRIKYNDAEITVSEVKPEISENISKAGDLADILEMDDAEFEAVAEEIEKMAFPEDDILEIPPKRTSEETDAMIEAHWQSKFDESEIETDARFAHTLEHIAENGHSREAIERVKTKLLEPFDFTIAVGEDVLRRPEAETVSIEFDNQLVETPQHFRTVELSNGAKILIQSDLNIFELKPHEAKFCFALVDLIDEFEGAK